MAKYAVTIHGWHPARLNTFLRNWGKEHRLKSADRKIVADYCCMAGRIPPATGKRRVSLTIVLGKGQRGGDPDAYYKSVGDALKGCGMLVDDDRFGVEWAPVQFERSTVPATRIELEDMP